MKAVPILPRLLDLAGERATAVMALGVVLGVALPPLADLFQPLLLPALMLPFTIALMRIDVARLTDHLRRPLPVALAVVASLVVAPLLVAAIIAPLPLPPLLHSALVTQAACAPLFSAAALALLLGLAADQALVVTVLATALAPLTVPPLAFHLGGLAVPLDALDLTVRLVLIVGSGVVLARLSRYLLGKGRLARHRLRLDGIAVLGFAAFALGIMGDVAFETWRRPGLVALYLAAAIALNAGLQAAATLVFRPLVGLRSALTFGLCCGNNNFGLVLAAMGGAAPPDLVLFVALAQVPIYLLPGLQRPLYRRWFERERSE